MFSALEKCHQSFKHSVRLPASLCFGLELIEGSPIAFHQHMSQGKKCTSLSFSYAIVASPGSKQMQTHRVSQQPVQRSCHGMLLVTWGLSHLNDSSLLRCPFLLHFSHFSLGGHILGPRREQACTTLKKGEKQKEPKPSR